MFLRYPYRDRVDEYVASRFPTAKEIIPVYANNVTLELNTPSFNPYDHDPEFIENDRYYVIRDERGYNLYRTRCLSTMREVLTEDSAFKKRLFLEGMDGYAFTVKFKSMVPIIAMHDGTQLRWCFANGDDENSWTSDITGAVITGATEEDRFYTHAGKKLYRATASYLMGHDLVVNQSLLYEDPFKNIVDMKQVECWRDSDVVDPFYTFTAIITFDDGTKRLFVGDKKKYTVSGYYSIIEPICGDVALDYHQYRQLSRFNKYGHVEGINPLLADVNCKKALKKVYFVTGMTFNVAEKDGDPLQEYIVTADGEQGILKEMYGELDLETIKVSKRGRS